MQIQPKYMNFLLCASIVERQVYRVVTFTVFGLFSTMTTKSYNNTNIVKGSFLFKLLSLFTTDNWQGVGWFFVAIPRTLYVFLCFTENNKRQML